MKIDSQQYKSVTGAVVLLVAFVILSLWLIFEYLDNVRSRDMQGWQSKLALLSELRVSSIEDLNNKNRADIEELSSNTTIQLFLSQYSSDKESQSPLMRAQQGHVRNLMSASAIRLGVSGVRAGPENIAGVTDYGLAIISPDNKVVMSTRGLRIDSEGFNDDLNWVSTHKKSRVIDLYKSKTNNIVYGFVAPVFHIQSIAERKIVGYIVLLINPQNNLYKLLENKQSITKTDETILLRTEGPGIVYLSPLTEGFETFHRQPDNNNILAASFAFHGEGDFAVRQDYKGEKVLVTGRKINGTEWGVLQKINASEALAESDQHQRFLLTVFSIIVLFLVAVFVAIWRHSTSVRLKKLSEDLETHSALLDSVTDNIQDHIMLVDEGSKVRFMNPGFMDELDIDSQVVTAAKLSTILGNKTAAKIETIPVGEQAVTKCLEINGKERSYHVSVTKPASGSYQTSKLYVLHDISELKKAQEKREQLGKGIITTLVKAVDLHDPYCANHSERTREVALEIARELNISEERQESLEMAALLANIGKLFVPQDILTKMEPLSSEESEMLKKHIEHAVEILSDLSFNGPVIEIISQKNERRDGSGYPKGLSGEDILLESSILAVANAFVAMASSRAYREGRPVKEVVDLLLDQADKHYDRQVVAALFHISENRHDWKKWQEISK